MKSDGVYVAGHSTFEIAIPDTVAAVISTNSARFRMSFSVCRRKRRPVHLQMDDEERDENDAEPLVARQPGEADGHEEQETHEQRDVERDENSGTAHVANYAKE